MAKTCENCIDKLLGDICSGIPAPRAAPLAALMLLKAVVILAQQRGVGLDGLPDPE